MLCYRSMRVKVVAYGQTANEVCRRRCRDHLLGSVVKDLELDLEHVQTWFPQETTAPYVLVRVSEEQAQSWAAALGIAVRRCYVTDALLSESSAARNVPQRDIIAAKLPDAGSTMAGDFGEILVYLYQ